MFGTMEEPYLFLFMPFVEIEIRLGTILSNKRFDSNVDKKYFDKILSHLESYQNWKEVIVINTSEYINNNTKYIKEDSGHGTIMVVQKDNIFKKDISDVHSPFDIRISINQEFNLKSQVDVLKNNISGSDMRIKSRKSFITDNFKYDLTVVTEIVNNIKKEKYEIEIEMIINKYTLTFNKQYLNDFLECKIYDLIHIVEPIERDKIKLELF